MSNKVTVNVDINGIKYPVSCISGEEDRLIESSQEVNKVIEDLSKVSGVVGETRLLAMTSLILADKIINKESSPDKDLNLTEIEEIDKQIEGEGSEGEGEQAVPVITPRKEANGSKEKEPTLKPKEGEKDVGRSN